MHPEAGSPPATSSRPERHVNPIPGGLPPDFPQGGGVLVAQHGSFAASEHSSHPMAMPRQPQVANGEHSVMYAVEPARVDPRSDLALRKSE